MKTKHTKGEWESMTEQIDSIKNNAGRYQSSVRVGAPLPENIICQVFGKSNEQCKANAKLIAAAPELLNACITVFETIKKRGKVSGDIELLRLFALCETVIKKAIDIRKD